MGKKFKANQQLSITSINNVWLCCNRHSTLLPMSCEITCHIRHKETVHSDFRWNSLYFQTWFAPKLFYDGKRNGIRTLLPPLKPMVAALVVYPHSLEKNVQKVKLQFSNFLRPFLEDVVKAIHQIRQQYKVKNKAAIALQCESNVKLIATFTRCP